MLLDIRNCTKPLPSIRVIFMVCHHDYKKSNTQFSYVTMTIFFFEKNKKTI